MRDFSLDKGFQAKVRIYLQGPDPVNELSGCRLLLDAPNLSEAIECGYGAFKELLIDFRKMDLNDLSHHHLFRECNVMEIAAAEEWIGKVFFGIGCNNNDRPEFSLDCFINLDDIELHLIEDIEHIVLEIGVSFIDLIDEQNH